MTTDNEQLIELPERTISQLLACDTYQGMSDDEIERIIDYKVEQRFQGELAVGQMNAINETCSQALSDAVEFHAAMQEMNERIANRTFEFGVISDEQA